MMNTINKMEEEVWKDISGWEGVYQVSNLGRVRSVDRWSLRKAKRFIKGRVLKNRYDKDGYHVVHLRNAPKSKLLKVHRLVAESFIPSIENKNQVDHINGKRDDNRISNLRWCSTVENQNYPLAVKNKSEATKRSYDKYPYLRQIRSGTLFKSKVYEIEVYKDGIPIGKYKNQKEVSEIIGFTLDVINKCLSGIYESYYGYTFKKIIK